MYTLIFLLYSLTFSVHTDQGPTVDPNGGTVRSATGDHRCTIDPNGNCVGGFSGTAGDGGGGMDPNG